MHRFLVERNSFLYFENYLVPQTVGHFLVECHNLVDCRAFLILMPGLCRLEPPKLVSKLISHRLGGSTLRFLRRFPPPCLYAREYSYDIFVCCYFVGFIVLLLFILNAQQCLILETYTPLVERSGVPIRVPPYFKKNASIYLFIFWLCSFFYKLYFWFNLIKLSKIKFEYSK